MIRFILVQVIFFTSFDPNSILIVFFHFTRIAKARHGCLSGTFHTMMKKRYVLLKLEVGFRFTTLGAAPSAW